MVHIVVEPATQYIISLRAFNNQGKGPVVYDLIYTRDAAGITDYTGPYIGGGLLLENATATFSNGFITARRNACIASAVLDTAIPSVCPSVRHTPVLCQNDGTYSTVQLALLDSKMCLVL